MRMRWQATDPSSERSSRRSTTALEPDERQRVVMSNLAQLAGNRAMGMMLNRSVSDAPALSDVASGSSARLPDSARLGGLLGADLSNVRVTLGGPAATSALTAARAHAATIGDNIVFDSPNPSPSVVAHEATHVVQQRNGTGGNRSGAEAEAHRVADGITAGRSMAVASTAPSGPQLLSWDEGSSALGNLWSKAKSAIFGDGSIDYARFLREDPAGKRMVEKAKSEIRQAALFESDKYLANISGGAAWDHSLMLQPDSIENGLKIDTSQYPELWPTMPDWQQAIGGYVLWISAQVEVDVDTELGWRTMKFHDVQLKVDVPSSGKNAETQLHMDDVRRKWDPPKWAKPMSSSDLLGPAGRAR